LIETHRHNSRALLASVIAALALTFSPSALAADSIATGIVGSQLSLVVSTPAVMTFTPSTDGVASSLVTVTSTQPSWSLTVHDALATTPGQMDEVNCVTRALAGGSLGTALFWSAPAEGTSGSLSSTPATVKAGGAFVDTVTVNFTQAVDPAEDLATGDCYQVTLSWTVA
jgi:hypothetical protein